MIDILRIFAPDAPFNQKELLLIFHTFFRQLVFIKDPTGPLFSYYFYLLESISTVKSVGLLGNSGSTFSHLTNLVDLRCDDIINQVFHDFFDIIK